MKGNVQTMLSKRTRPVQNETVIHFLEPPAYRDYEVDISSKLPVQLFEIKQYRGELRATVSSAVHLPSQCRVVIEGKRFSVQVGYTGPVSIGIEEA